MPPSEQQDAGVLARGYAFVVVGLRYLVVGAWAAGVVLAILFLPPLNATSGGLSDLIPPDSAAAHAESDAARLFGFPIDAAVAIVQRDPHGMPAATRDRAIRQAIAVDRRLSGQPGQLAQLATAAAALAKAGQPDAAQALSGPVSPGPPGGIAGLAGAFPLLAPVYLLVASVLAVFATLGLTILIGQDILGYGSLVYFVPFAAGVLLVSLGSDYNVFVVGRIWEEARRRPVADAVAAQASRAITTAGVALAASFAMLAVIPLEQFRQIAIAMALGVVIDAIAVRSLLVPALVALFGRLGMWPGNRRPPRAPADTPDGAALRAASGDEVSQIRS